jgi:hypothetical protein
VTNLAPLINKQFALEESPAKQQPFHYGYNFIPFGVGQFKNNKNTKAIIYLTIEATALANSLIALSLYELEKDGAGGFDDADSAGAYRTWFMASFFTFIGTAVLGVVDSILDYHQTMDEMAAFAGGEISLCLSPNSAGIRYDF